MAERPKIHEERLEQLMAYYGGDLSGDDLAEFEAHLATCEDCQRTLRQARQVLPVAEAMLAFKPKRTIDEQVARFEAMWAEKGRAEGRLRRTRPAPSRLWLGLAVAMAALVVATFLLWRVAPTMTRRGQEVYMPQPPSDAGGR